MLKQTLEPEAAVEISPELAHRVEASLAMYNMLSLQAEAEKTMIIAMLEEAGITKHAALDRLMYKTVGSTSTSLDKKKLVALGVSEATIEAATTRKPKKPYWTFRKAGEKDASE